MPCSTCTDAARCDRAGLCQDFARKQLQKPTMPVIEVRRCHLCEFACAEEELEGARCTSVCALLQHYP